MNKQELIKEYESIVKDDSLELCGCYNMADKIFMRKIYKSVLEDLEQLDEPQKPVVPQFVADWYEENKYDLEFNIWDWIKYTQEEEKIENRQFTEWLGESENKPVETLVKMKLYGYTVEKEKQYLVKMKVLETGFGFLNLHKTENYWLFSSKDESVTYQVYHTRKELEEAGFGWVFDCPGMEVEEVEE